MFTVSQFEYNLILKIKLWVLLWQKNLYTCITIWDYIVVQCNKLTITQLTLIIANDTDHPLYFHFTLMPSDHRDRTLKCRRAGFGRGFFPYAIAALNKRSHWHYCLSPDSSVWVHTCIYNYGRGNRQGEKVLWVVWSSVYILYCVYAWVSVWTIYRL